MKWLDENWFKITFSFLMLLLILTLNKGVMAVKELSKNGRYIHHGEGTILDTHLEVIYVHNAEGYKIEDTLENRFVQFSPQIKH